MIQARVVDGVCLEVFRGDLKGKFHPDFIAGLVSLPDDVQPGMVTDGKHWGWPAKIGAVMADPAASQTVHVDTSQLEAKIAALEADMTRLVQISANAMRG